MDSATRYQHILDRNRAYDGRFITGVLTTGIYCLPSCPARKPKLENIRFFSNESQAQQAGLRPCLRCRPDLFYRGSSADEAIYEGLQQRLMQQPDSVAQVADLARLAGISRSKLAELCREHGHTSPAQLLRRARLSQAARCLLQEDGPVADIGYSAGFNSEAAFHRQFLQTFALTPAAYRAIPQQPAFQLQLPADYRAEEVLAYLGRDSDGPAEKRQGQHLCKALLLEGQPVRLSLTLSPGKAICQLHSQHPIRPAQTIAAHAVALRCLGLQGGVAGLQRHARQQGDWQRLIAARPGLHLPLSASVFESLVWAIVGQQVNLTFATKLRRTVIELAGQTAGEGMLAHPDVAAVAALDPAQLCQHQFSRAKAAYLVDTARYLLAHGIDIEALPQQSAPAALRRLTAIRGIGPWTAQYALLRGVGFSDCVPVGDAGLVLALQRFFGLPSRPGPEQTQTLMRQFAPWRSLATAHLWASLKDSP